MIWRREKSHAPTRIQTLGGPACTLVTILTMSSWLPKNYESYVKYVELVWAPCLLCVEGSVQGVSCMCWNHAINMLCCRRVEWSTTEDNLLLLCKVASMYLCPIPRKQIINFQMIRDCLHQICPVSELQGMCWPLEILEVV